MTGSSTWHTPRFRVAPMKSSSPRPIHKLVDEKVRLWGALSTKARDEPEVLELVPSRQRPVITVSRSFGALGLQVAKRIADGLGFSLWGRELVDVTAKQVGANLRSVRGLDERVRSSWDDLVDTMVYDAVPQQRFADLLFEVIRSVARMGSAVIVGRGAQFIVDPRESLRVRLSAPFEMRVRRYAEKHELSFKEAEKIVRESDRERDQFLRHHFCMDSGDLHNYDLCLNTSCLTTEQACSMLVSAYNAKFRGLIDVEKVEQAMCSFEEKEDGDDRSSIPAPPAQSAAVTWPPRPMIEEMMPEVRPETEDRWTWDSTK